MATQIQVRRDTAANWALPENNPVLASGEIGFETDTNKFKIGDEVTAWNSLAYAGGSELGNALVNVNSVESESGSDLRLEGNLNVEIFTQGNDINSGNPDVTIGYGGVSCYSVSVTEVNRNVYTETLGGGSISLDYNNGQLQVLALSGGDPTVIDINNGQGGSQLNVIVLQPAGVDCLFQVGGNVATPGGTVTSAGGGNNAYDQFMVARFNKVGSTWMIEDNVQALKAPNA